MYSRKSKLGGVSSLSIAPYSFFFFISCCFILTISVTFIEGVNAKDLLSSQQRKPTTREFLQRAAQRLEPDEMEHLRGFLMERQPTTSGDNYDINYFNKGKKENNGNDDDNNNHITTEATAATITFPPNTIARATDGGIGRSTPPTDDGGSSSISISSSTSSGVTFTNRGGGAAPIFPSSSSSPSNYNYYNQKGFKALIDSFLPSPEPGKPTLTDVLEEKGEECSTILYLYTPNIIKHWWCEWNQTWHGWGKTVLVLFFIVGTIFACWCFPLIFCITRCIGNVMSILCCCCSCRDNNRN